ncbi:hypothetical protein [Salinarimonas ramus]|uniref:Acylphosphatase n=1 Tax=Salinarimonas ramus TaxID=690164 RepID=A0A917Q6I6_9HYPH|nr:hypothetical protein [Salinarimonas ramus]GGK30530.1 hypothetical protein GCM10011322_16310 [Salinarimonas ramus]
MSADPPADDDHVEVRLRLAGRALDEGYRAFAEERLFRYGLAGGVRVEPGAREATIVARGPAALVDMLEVACLLGPARSLVESCVSEDATLGTALA